MNTAKIKRAAILVLAALLVLTGIVLVSTRASSAMSAEEARELATSYVPDTAVFSHIEREWQGYEVCFTDDGGNIIYEVDINKTSGLVTELSMEKKGAEGGSAQVISEEEAKSIVLARFPEATGLNAELSEEDGLLSYEVQFSAPDLYGECEVDAETGDICEYTLHFGTVTLIPIDDDRAVAPGDGRQVEEGQGPADGEDTEEPQPAEGQPGAKSDPAEKPSDQQEPADPAEGTEQPVQDGTAGSLISEEEALSIVLAKVPGAEITEIKLELEDGIYIYDIEAILGDTEYEFEISAATGVITEWEAEPFDD